MMIFCLPLKLLALSIAAFFMKLTTSNIGYLGDVLGHHTNGVTLELVFNWSRKRDPLLL